jgi:hypothetical protein
MLKKDLLIKGILAMFEQEHKQVLKELDELNESITNLQYEGKMSFAKNTRTIEKTTRFFKNKLYNHIELDEKVIFPYVQVHIPKLEPMLCFLRAERNEFKLSMENFELLFRQLKEEKNGLRQQKIIDQVKEKGMYVICLMRNHIQIEIESVYKPMDLQLHQEEKKELINRCLKYKFI